MNKLLTILTCCSILGACAGSPEINKSGKPLIDFESIASQIEVRYETLPEAGQPPDPVAAAADTSR